MCTYAHNSFSGNALLLHCGIEGKATVAKDVRDNAFQYGLILSCVYSSCGTKEKSLGVFR